MTPDDFAALARMLARDGIAFRARPGPRTLKRCPEMVVVNIDLAQHSETDMLEGLEAAERPPQGP